MAGRLNDKTAVVSGAGSGNGRATAIGFAREGARVVVADIRHAAAEETGAAIRAAGGDCRVVTADVARREDVAAMVEECTAAWGGIDILVNNVGILAPGGVEDIAEADWDRVYQTNLKSILFACRTALPHMRRTGSGAIINISSISGSRHLGIDYIAYPTSKAAIDQMTRIMAVQYGPLGIRCNAILPGFIDTPMVRNQVVGALGVPDGDAEAAYEAYRARRAGQTPLRRLGTAEDIANAAVFLASDEASYITGHLLVVDGGVTQSIGN